MKLGHIVCTYNNKNGKCLYEEKFPTAEAAYEDWKNCIRILRKTLPVGHEILVIRYRDGYPMAVELVIGTN